MWIIKNWAEGHSRKEVEEEMKKIKKIIDSVLSA
jgi:hypothetical protein